MKNNKGFAISTLLYGISLMGVMIVVLLMSIMSSNRKNTSTMVKDVEEELNRLSLTNTTINTDGTDKPYVIPEKGSGWYKIQLWGAGSATKYGAYTSGIIYLNAGQNLYFDIGSTATGKSANTVVKVSNDTNTITSSGGGLVKDYTYIMRAMGKDQGKDGPSQAGAGKITTGNFIAGYPGVRAYFANTSEKKYTVGNLSFVYRQFVINNDDRGFDTASTTYAFLDPYIVTGVNVGVGKAKIDKISSNSKNNPPINLSSKATFSNIKITQTMGAKGLNEIQALYYDGTTGEVANGITSTDATLKNACDYDISTTATFNNGQEKTYNCTSRPYYGIGLNHPNKTITSIDLKLSNGQNIHLGSGTEPAYGIYYSLLKASVFGLRTGEFPDSADFWIGPADSPNVLMTSDTSSNVITARISDSQNQKWHIEKVGSYYKIVESSKNYSLRIDDVDEHTGEDYSNAEENSYLSTATPFKEPNGLNEELWQLVVAPDWRYVYIKSAKTKTRAKQDLYLGTSSSKLVVKTTPTPFNLKNQSY